jgi:hypothetical protein
MSAFFLIFFKFFSSKKQLIVLILFLLANFARFLAGSTPRMFLNPLSLKGFRATPSLLPISIMYDFFAESLKSFIYFLAASIKCFLKVSETMKG